MPDYGPDDVLLALPPGIHERSLPAIRAVAEFLVEVAPRAVGTGAVARAVADQLGCRWTVASHLERLVGMGFVESQRVAGGRLTWRWKGTEGE